MDRELLHQSIMSLKGRISTGELTFNGCEEYVFHQLDKVKELEDGLVDINTVSSSLRLLLQAAEPQKREGLMG
ncbi:hypothetical protein SAMN05216353_11938 [Halobacillus alkaliphilus]|uniref:Uncharacterized protein n=1 Tax=Halobacillus alkaliphilus TaxID=396056 RepID=A0A1I2NGS3_9BACI|nr:hypothetical protein [Halobacillus alkaliphilus]SFG02813.1 hypothetical protein SAMN05216353_11938 [Halobacillus alkaliphilus]